MVGLTLHVSGGQKPSPSFIGSFSRTAPAPYKLWTFSDELCTAALILQRCARCSQTHRSQIYDQKFSAYYSHRPAGRTRGAKRESDVCSENDRLPDTCPPTCGS
jgi:hypothetical protein